MKTVFLMAQRMTRAALVLAVVGGAAALPLDRAAFANEPSADTASAGYRVEKVLEGAAPTLDQSTIDESRSTMSLTTDDEVRIRVRQNGDELRVWIDGARLADEKVSDASWNRLRILAPDGEVAATVVKREGGDLSLFTGEFNAESEARWNQARERARGQSSRATDRAMRELAEAERRLAEAGAARERMLAVPAPTAPMPPMPAMAPMAPAIAQGLAWGAEGEQPRVWGAARTMPRVMMGVTMSTPDESVAQQLGIDADEATLISGVSKDLPADRAGLKPYDIVVKVDGKTPANEDSIRRELRSKNVGDSITFDVLRGGQPVSVTIQLEAFEPAKLGWGAAALAPLPAMGEGSAWTMMWTEQQEKLQGMQRELARMSGELASKASQLAREQSAAASAKIGEAMRELGEQMSKLGAEMAESSAAQSVRTFAGPGFRADLLRRLEGLRGQQLRIEEREGGAATVTVLPDDELEALAEADAAASGELHSEVRKLDERMGSVDARLKRLEELLEVIAASKDRETKKPN